MSKSFCRAIVRGMAGLAVVTAWSFASAATDRADGAAGHAVVRTRPAALDMALDRLSERGLYRVVVRSLEPAIPLNRLHSWSVTVERDGKPVDGAVLTFDGGMPEHGHGYPTTPRVEANPDGGYLIRGVRFSMRGWWEFKLVVRARPGTDQVTFNVIL